MIADLPAADEINAALEAVGALEAPAIKVLRADTDAYQRLKQVVESRVKALAASGSHADTLSINRVLRTILVLGRNDDEYRASILDIHRARFEKWEAAVKQNDVFWLCQMILARNDLGRRSRSDNYMIGWSRQLPDSHPRPYSQATATLLISEELFSNSNRTSLVAQEVFATMRRLHVCSHRSEHASMCWSWARIAFATCEIAYLATIDASRTPSDALKLITAVAAEHGYVIHRETGDAPRVWLEMLMHFRRDPEFAHAKECFDMCMSLAPMVVRPPLGDVWLDDITELRQMACDISTSRVWPENVTLGACRVLEQLLKHSHFVSKPDFGYVTVVLHQLLLCGTERTIRRATEVIPLLCIRTTCRDISREFVDGDAFSDRLGFLNTDPGAASVHKSAWHVALEISAITPGGIHELRALAKELISRLAVLHHQKEEKITSKLHELLGDESHFLDSEFSPLRALMACDPDLAFLPDIMRHVRDIAPEVWSGFSARLHGSRAHSHGSGRAFERLAIHLEKAATAQSQCMICRFGVPHSHWAVIPDTVFAEDTASDQFPVAQVYHGGGEDGFPLDPNATCDFDEPDADSKYPQYHVPADSRHLVASLEVEGKPTYPMPHIDWPHHNGLGHSHANWNSPGPYENHGFTLPTHYHGLTGSNPSLVEEDGIGDSGYGSPTHARDPHKSLEMPGRLDHEDEVERDNKLEAGR
ncbi:hypothetical protein BKA62DRAFT_834933 [Auriculariales sp. MPI-PUGE-AT-0066]|nr:hypothetical protein BKA62DRAFT_834933 [Auriculariales sp. MPI-PUGE-AT-0066]